MQLLSLFDAPSALIVFGGTFAGTVLRCGLSNCAMTVREITHIVQRKFDPEATRAELSIHIREIQTDGLVRALPHQFGDSEFNEATEAFIEHRSISALLERHESHKQIRLTQNAQATLTLMTASELSPVFGLAGTLISLNQVSIQTAGSSADGLVGAIGMAVVTTFYGLLAAHLIFYPLARFLERRASKEEAERQALIDWLSQQLLLVCKPAGSANKARPDAA